MTTVTTAPARAALVTFIQDLVAAGQPWCENSLDGPLRPPEEIGAAQVAGELLASWGFTVTYAGRDERRPNVIARLRFGPGPTLMLNDHLDTYPSGPPSRWTKCEHPYTAVEDDGRIYARGTSDTRGNLAALLIAAQRVAERPPSAGTLLVALTVDEERNGVEGSQYLTGEYGLRVDASITVEPTAVRHASRPTIRLATRQTGHALLDVSFTGVSSHIWRPDTGRNPSTSLRQLLAGFEEDPPGGWPVSVVGLAAGEQGMAQFTPLEARARIALVGVGADVARGDVLAVVHDRALRVCGPGIRPHVEYVPGPTFVPGTEELAGDDPLVVAIDEAYRAHTGEPVQRYTKPAFNDTIVFRHAGIPAVTFGPGEEGWAVYDESIGLEHVELAAEVITEAVHRFLSR